MLVPRPPGTPTKSKNLSTFVSNESFWRILGCHGIPNIKPSEATSYAWRRIKPREAGGFFVTWRLEPRVKGELQAMQEAKFAVNVCSAAWWLQPISKDNWIISPGRCENIKYLKPPPRKFTVTVCVFKMVFAIRDLSLPNSRHPLHLPACWSVCSHAGWGVSTFVHKTL